jgi:hypothetical protein
MHNREAKFIQSVNKKLGLQKSTRVGIATGYALDGPGSIPGSERFSILPDRLWGPDSLLSNGYRGFLPRGKAAGA